MTTPSSPENNPADASPTGPSFDTTIHFAPYGSDVNKGIPSWIQDPTPFDHSHVFPDPGHFQDPEHDDEHVRRFLGSPHGTGKYDPHSESDPHTSGEVDEKFPALLGLRLAVARIRLGHAEEKHHKSVRDYERARGIGEAAIKGDNYLKMTNADRPANGTDRRFARRYERTLAKRRLHVARAYSLQKPYAVDKDPNTGKVTAQVSSIDKPNSTWFFSRFNWFENKRFHRQNLKNISKTDSQLYVLVGKPALDAHKASEKRGRFSAQVARLEAAKARRDAKKNGTA